MLNVKSKSASVMLIWVVGYFFLNFFPIYVLGFIQGFPLHIFFINEHKIELSSLNKLSGVSICLMTALYITVFYGRLPRVKVFAYSSSRIQGVLLLFISLGLLIYLPDYSELSAVHLLILKALYYLGMSTVALNPSLKNFAVFFLICLSIGLCGVRGPLISCLIFFALHNWSNKKLHLIRVINKKSFLMLILIPMFAILLAQFRAKAGLSLDLSFPYEVISHMRTISLSLFAASKMDLDFYSTFSDVLPLGGMFLKIFGVQSQSLPDLLTQSLPGASQYPGVGIGASTLSVFFAAKSLSSVVTIMFSLVFLRAVIQLLPRNILYFFVMFQIPVLLRKGFFDIYFELILFSLAFLFLITIRKLRV